MNKGKVSIIIPVYNAEKFLERCIRSILNQTYSNFEILLIDDGSTDNSSIICKNASSIDRRIKYYNKKNGGVSSARNFGIKKAKGDYCCFVDSDDYIEKKYLEILVSNLIKTNSDISVCSYKRVNSTIGDTFIYSDNDFKVFNMNEAYDEMIANKSFSGYVWNKLYKMDYIKKIEGPVFKEKMIEDFEFNCRILNNCKKIVYTSMQLYFYYINEYSLTGSLKVNENTIQGITAYYNILKQYDEKGLKSGDLVAFELVKYIYNLNYRIHESKCSSRVTLDEKLYKRIIKSKIVKSKDKRLLRIIHRFPLLSYKLKNKIK